MRGLLIAVLLLLAHPARAQPDTVIAPLRLDAESVGAPGSLRRQIYHAPPAPGAARVPAVILMHGCAGVTPTATRWAERVKGWGYAALVVDSFTPRGFANVCGKVGAFPPRLRAADGFAAAAYLRARPEIDPDRIAVVGFSHGGSTALVLALRATVDALAEPPLRAVVAFYPFCGRRSAPLASDTLILIGSDDDWTPAERCETLRRDWDPANGELSVVVYPGARHSFDSPMRERMYFGHRLAHDPLATEDAAERLRSFLAQRFAR